MAQILLLPQPWRNYHLELENGEVKATEGTGTSVKSNKTWSAVSRVDIVVRAHWFLVEESAKDLFLLAWNRTFPTPLLAEIAANDIRWKAEENRIERAGLCWKELEFIQWKILDLKATLSGMTWTTCYSCHVLMKSAANTTQKGTAKRKGLQYYLGKNGWPWIKSTRSYSECLIGRISVQEFVCVKQLKRKASVYYLGWCQATNMVHPEERQMWPWYVSDTSHTRSNKSMDYTKFLWHLICTVVHNVGHLYSGKGKWNCSSAK